MIRFGKNVVQSKQQKTKLILEILQAYAFDERNLTKPYYGTEYYRVMVWTNSPEKQYGTQVARSTYGISNFNQTLVIPLDSHDQHLHIELIRGVSKRDPGTSNGTHLMGRAKIKLPPWTSRGEFNSMVDLVGLDSKGSCVFKGYLQLSMQLHRYYVKS